jgi:hypothetical protein
MALAYQGRYVKMEISEARLRGNIRSVSLKLLPETLRALCALDVPKPKDMASVRPGEFAALAKTVRSGDTVFPRESLVRVISKRHGVAIVQILLCRELVEIQLPEQVLVSAKPVDEGFSIECGLHAKVRLLKEKSVDRLAYKGAIETPQGRVSVESDGESSVNISGAGLGYLKGVLEDEVCRLMGRADHFGCLVQRYAEFSATAGGLMSFPAYIEGVLGDVAGLRGFAINA